MNDMPRRRRLAILLIAVGILLALPLSLYPGSNVFCRVGMTFNIVDSLRLDLGQWASLTNDVAAVENAPETTKVSYQPPGAEEPVDLTVNVGRPEVSYYNDKAPGSALLAVPFYALTKVWIRLTNIWFGYEFARHLIRLLTLLPLCLLGAWYGAKFLRKAEIKSDLFPVAWLLGTVAFPFSLLLFGHQYAACLILLSYLCLRKYKEEPEQRTSFALPMLAGGMTGYAIYTEYPTAILALLLGLYFLTFERRINRILEFGVPGAIFPALGLMLYNKAVFGGFFVTGYNSLQDAANAGGMSQGILGVGIPNLSGLWEITFSPAGGLFYTAPWLLFFPIGLFRMIRKKGYRMDAIFFLLMILAYFAFNAGYWEPGGAGSFGPRHLVPMVPFIAIAAFWGGATSGRFLRTIFNALFFISILLTGFGTFADPTMPDRIANPLIEFALPIMSLGFGLEAPWLNLSGLMLFLVFLLILSLVLLLTRIGIREKNGGPSYHLFFATVSFFVVLYLAVIPYVSHTEPGIKNQVIGNYFFQRHEYLLAEQSYFKAAQTRRDPAIHYYRGLALLRLGRIYDMTRELQLALEIQPNSPVTPNIQLLLQNSPYYDE